MRIYKINEEIPYRKILKEHTFEINGKIIHVNEYTLYDATIGEYDDDIKISEDDAKELTEEEYEAIGENLIELLELKPEETYESN